MREGFGFFLIVVLLIWLAVVEATRPTSCWQCGNHEPAHTTPSIEGVVELTKSSGCKLWHYK